jgi:hypothetical protein
MILGKRVDEVPIELIQECERLSELKGRVYFIFDTYSRNYIESSKFVDKSEKREYIFDELFDQKDEDQLLYIGDENDLNELPSRYIYYDTETKQTDRYKRYQVALDFLKRIGFEPSENNLGMEYEQVFRMIEIYEDTEVSVEIRINQNLLIKTSYSRSTKTSAGYSGESGPMNYGVFFREKRIMETLNRVKWSNPNFMKQRIRDIVIQSLLD